MKLSNASTRGADAFRVVIIQRVLPHYRVEFFNRLHSRLGAEGIDLTVLYGREKENTVPKSVSPGEPWFVEIRNTYLSLRGRELVWQSVPWVRLGADLIIVEQAIRLLINFPLQVARLMRRGKLAYWGHGKNFQATSFGWIEFAKRMLITKVDWWFAYTDLSASEIAAAGMPDSRMTVVNNAIDTDAFKSALSAITDEVVLNKLAALGLKGRCVALYCGGMYPEKRLDFLLDAAQLIREQIPDFELVMIGDGPEAWKIRDAATIHSWIKYLGPVFDSDRAVYFKMAKILLMPGLVGLAIVDAFVAGCPMATTDNGIHSPEIAYLRDGVNGLMSADSVESFSAMVVTALRDETRMIQLKAGCEKSANEISLNSMVDRFATGVVNCLLGRGAGE